MNAMDVPEFDCDDVSSLRPHVDAFLEGAGLDLFGFAALQRTPDGDGERPLHLLTSAGQAWPPP